MIIEILTRLWILRIAPSFYGTTTGCSAAGTGRVLLLELGLKGGISGGDVEYSFQARELFISSLLERRTRIMRKTIAPIDWIFYTKYYTRGSVLL